MKTLKFGLRLWITITSTISFLVGWIMLAHAPKPSPLLLPASNTASLPTLEPLPPLSGPGSDDHSLQSQPLFGVQPSFRPSSRPSFTTGGS